MKKYMVKQLTFITLLCFFTVLSNKARCQQLIFLYGHVLYAAPVDNYFKSNYNFGAGVEGGAGLRLLGQTFLTGTVGYTRFQHSVLNVSGGIGYVPLKIGLRRYVFEKMLYIHADAGAGIISSSANTSMTKFSGDFGVGVKFGYFELQADYDGFNASNPASYASWIGIKAGFNFGI